MTGVVLVEVRLFDDCLPIASYFLAYSSNSAASDDTGRRPPGDDRQADDTWGAKQLAMEGWREGGRCCFSKSEFLKVSNLRSY